MGSNGLEAKPIIVMNKQHYILALLLLLFSLQGCLANPSIHFHVLSLNPQNGCLTVSIENKSDSVLFISSSELQKPTYVIVKNGSSYGVAGKKSHKTKELFIQLDMWIKNYPTNNTRVITCQLPNYSSNSAKALLNGTITLSFIAKAYNFSKGKTFTVTENISIPFTLLKE